MKTKDKLAIWSVVIMLLSALGDFLKIYEFGSINNYLIYVDVGFSPLATLIILTSQLLWGIIAIIACVYLFIIYPLELIKENKK